MADKLFREKSLKKIASPEELDRYIRISRPSIWLILSAIIVLLVGICIWGIFGSLKTTTEVKGLVESGEMISVISSQEGSQVQPGMAVYLDDEKVGEVVDVSYNAEGELVAKLSLSNLADGSYTLTIMIENIHPLYFILN